MVGEGGEAVGDVVQSNGGEALAPRLAPAPRQGNADFGDAAAAEGAFEVVVAQYEPVPDLHVEWFLADDIADCGGPGLDGGALDQQDAGLGVTGGVVGVNRCVVFHRTWKVVQNRKSGGESVNRLPRGGIE